MKHYNIIVEGKEKVTEVINILKKLGTLEIRWTSGRRYGEKGDLYYVSVIGTEEAFYESLKSINGMYIKTNLITLEGFMDPKWQMPQGRNRKA